MPRTIVLEDDSYFVLAAYYNGVAHPPGYPLYTLIGHLFSLLPVNTVAFRVHLCSAFFAALACSGFWLFTFFITRAKASAYLASLGLGLSSVFWSQSIIAEVYTLNVFLFVCILLFRIYFAYIQPTAKSVFLLGLVYGLSLSNHWPLLLLSTAALLFIFLPLIKPLLARLPVLLAGIILGLLPYAWMILNSQSQVFINFYGPINDWADFWFYISREAYADQDVSNTADMMDRLYFTGFVFKQIMEQFGIAGILLGLVGFVAQWKRVATHLCVGLTVIFLGNTVLLISLLGFDYDLWHRNIFRVYPLVAYAMFSIWLALGLQLLVSKLLELIKPKGNREFISAALTIVFVSSVFFAGMGLNYRATDSWAEDFARAILDTIEPGSVLFTHGDFDQGALVYTQQILGVREDVTLYNGKGVLLSNRLFYPTRVNNEQREQAINNFIEQAETPVYYTYGLPHTFNEVDYGLYHQIDTDSAYAGNMVLLNEDIINYLSKLLGKGVPVDPWQNMHYQLIVNDFCRFFLRLSGEPSGIAADAQQQQTINSVCHLLNGKLLQAELLMREEQPDWNRIAVLLDEAKASAGQAVLKSDTAKLYYLLAEMQFRQGQQDAAIDYYEKSIEAWPHKNNRSRARLKSIVNDV